jgi:hypothetical protein
VQLPVIALRLAPQQAGRGRPLFAEHQVKLAERVVNGPRT